MKSQKTILVVDDEAAMRKNLSELLGEEGFKIAEAVDGESAMSMVKDHRPNLILLDINLPRVDGLAVLVEVKRTQPDVPVIVFTAYGTSDRAIQAMKSGAYDYLEKPFDLDEFLLTIRRALNYSDLLDEVQNLRTKLSDAPTHLASTELIGSSPKMQEIFKTVGRVAGTDATVLIQGESGTGKELIADAIQRHSLRSDKPFIKVNCGGLPEMLLESEMFGHEKGSFTGAISRREGRFELANGGTIFLDEINNMPPALQMKLLRVLQHRTFERVGGKETLTVDVRIIAATNKDIEKEVKAGRFREDLYYRLNVVHIVIPPLREHLEDIPLLVEHFLNRYASGRRVVLSGEATQRVRTHTWPGNVRELENVIQRALVMAQGSVITKDDLPIESFPERKAAPRRGSPVLRTPLKKLTAGFEKTLILQALSETGWNRTKAAELLQIHRRLLFSKIKQYKIREPK
ncbi:MAG: sigma-54 dependent transcriptional regulator [Ignavibacteriales bacterium]|nr:sigma-54 dependent transcriptional regulator [Ignavibacteriales bacterium]